MNPMVLMRIKNQLLGTFMPKRVASSHADIFLSPRTFPFKSWEASAEQEGQRMTFGQDTGQRLSAIRWGAGDKRILLMHGWESRATQMHALAQPLIKHGFEVIAIDAPGHGLSSGKGSDPVQFSQAVMAAHHQWGPFYGAVGHSMGCAALAIANEQGAMIDRLVLLASPANMLAPLQDFSRFMGLPKTCTQRFFQTIDRRVGRPAHELDVGKLLSTGQSDVLLIHARNDAEVAFESMSVIHNQLEGAHMWVSPPLGHRKLVRDSGVADVVGRFMRHGTL